MKKKILTNPKYEYELEEQTYVFSAPKVKHILEFEKIGREENPTWEVLVSLIHSLLVSPEMKREELEEIFSIPILNQILQDIMADIGGQATGKKGKN